MQSRALISSITATLSAGAAAVTIAACSGGGGSSMPPVPLPSPTIAPVGCNQTVLRPQGATTRRIGSGLVVRFPSHDADPGQDVVPGVVAVRFGSRDAGRLASAAAALHGSIRSSVDANGAATIALPRGTDPAQAARSLRSMSGVVAAGPVVLRRTQSAQIIPNDPDFNTLPYNGVPNTPIQWDMYVMNMPSAWGLPTGFGSSTVKIAIIDTGYDLTNSDLKPAGRVAASIVFDKGDGTPHVGASIQDDDGHGTDVTGIAAADTNNADDVAGTAGDITLLEARVFPQGGQSASTRDIAAAIDWARTNGANVISMSLGSTTADPTFEEPAVARAIAAGITVVAAAGNGNAQGVGQPRLDFPAADPGVIAVGASAYCDGTDPRNYGGTSYEYVASYSNYTTPAKHIFVVAPGGDPSQLQINCLTNSCIDFLQWITNLYSNTATQFPGETILIAGTSQATPHIAGLAALMLTKDAALTPAEIAQIITANTVNINDSRQGSGRVDANAVLIATP